MPVPQSGHASVYFEVYFDKLAPSAVRTQIASSCTSVIDQLVPPATRDAWLDLPYTGDGSAADLLDFLTKRFSEVDPNLVPRPTPKSDFYCWMGSQRTCYATFSLENNGVPVSMSVQADGYQVDCEIRVVVATVPST